jgi:sodium transport system permease protein
LTAVFFGMAHGLIQQSMSAAAMGMVIGYIAVQTGSLLPCILFHVSYNALMFAIPFWPEFAADRPMLGRLFHEVAPGQILYNWPVLIACGAGSALLLMWLRQLPYQATREEQIHDARARQTHHPVAAGAQGGVE